MKSVSAESPSQGDFCYIPLHQTTYQLKSSPETKVSAFILLFYGNYPLHDGGNMGWPGWRWIASHLTGSFHDGFYDHGSRSPYFEDGLKSGQPYLLECESLGAAFRRAGCDLIADQLEADVPEEKGRDNFLSFVHKTWEDRILNRDFDSVELLQQVGADINAPLSGGSPPLIHFVRALDEDGVRQCLRLGAEVNTLDPILGKNALEIAQTVQQSPDPGVLPNAAFLEQAERGARAAVVQMLREHGAK